MRIRITVFAYAYEILNTSITSDSDYDQLSIKVFDTKDLPTDNPKYDDFFSKEFDKDTGMWIRSHPDCFTGKLEALTRYLIKLTTTEAV